MTSSEFRDFMIKAVREYDSFVWKDQMEFPEDWSGEMKLEDWLFGFVEHNSLPLDLRT